MYNYVRFLYIRKQGYNKVTFKYATLSFPGPQTDLKSHKILVTARN